MGCLSSRPPYVFGPSVSPLHHLAKRPFFPLFFSFKHDSTITNQFYSDQEVDEGCWCCLCFEEQIVRWYWWDRALPWKCWGWKSFTVAYRVEGALSRRRAVDLCKGMQSTAEHSCQLNDEGSDWSWCLQNVVSTMFELWHLPSKPTFHSGSLKQKGRWYGAVPLQGVQCVTLLQSCRIQLRTVRLFYEQWWMRYYRSCINHQCQFIIIKINVWAS